MSSKPASPEPAAAQPSVPAAQEEDPGILPASHWQAKADADAAAGSQDSNDTDSLSDISVGASTDSLSSSIMNYRMLHGRRYHSEIGNADYWGANDDRQSNSQDILLIHHVITLVCGGKLHLAPLEEDRIKTVLDVGTGTGTWVVDFADAYPQAEVIGTDISPIQADWSPPNARFEIEDCTLEWTFDADRFDYIHLRWLLGSIVDWNELFRQAYTACRPGGWVETFEPSDSIVSDDNTVTPRSAQGQWGKIFIEGEKRTGRPFSVVSKGLQRKAMEEAGFVDIKEVDLKFPLGTWPEDPETKMLGMFGQAAFEADTEGYILLIANVLGWTTKEISVYTDQLLREIRCDDFHGYYAAKIVYGRKPE